MEDLDKTWHHRWVSPKAKQSKSIINRNGLIATEDIPAGEPVIVYGGVVVPSTDYEKYIEKVGEYYVPINDNFAVAPTTSDEVLATGSVNHSCEPTVGWKDAITLVTIKDVKQGEELAPDYAMHGGYAGDMMCSCNTPSCRKIIRKDDWKNPKIREKYGGWFMPYLKEKF
jgi:hypothetical protein